MPDTRDGVGLFVKHGVVDFGFYLVDRRDRQVIGEIGFVGPPHEGRRRSGMRSSRPRAGRATRPRRSPRSRPGRSGSPTSTRCRSADAAGQRAVDPRAAARRLREDRRCRRCAASPTRGDERHEQPAVRVIGREQVRDHGLHDASLRSQLELLRRAAGRPTRVPRHRVLDGREPARLSPRRPLGPSARPRRSR